MNSLLIGDILFWPCHVQGHDGTLNLTRKEKPMRRTYYIYKGYDRQKAIAIITPNVNKERHVAELKRLAKENGHITIRNCLGGLVSQITEDGKIHSF
jgi:hypothetical protein